MPRLSLRARVAVAAATAIVLAVVLLGGAVLAQLGGQLRGSLDRSLRARAVDVARLSASAPRLLTAPGSLEGRLGGSTLFVQVIDRRGRIVARSSALGGRVLPDDRAVRTALRDRRTAYADGALGTEALRLYAAPLGTLGQGPAAGGAVIVAGTTADIDDTLATTRRLVVLSALAAAVLAALLALALTGRALRPLRRLSSGARGIERSGDPSARLPEPAAHDEVGELADTLNAMLASLERAQEGQRRFVGDASHELRTPLTALRGNAAYVARHGADPAVLGDIEADAARLSALLDDLLALAREDAAAPARGEPVDLVALAREAAGADPRADVVGAPADDVGAAGRAAHGDTGSGAPADAVPTHAVSARGAPRAPVLVRGEREALARAVANLVRNARRHGPADGDIAIAAGRDGDRAWISVEDQGPGLSPADAAHAFERFWRGPAAGGQGSGLGLAIVRAIAERHGGRVEVAGARFTIVLPALTDLSNAGGTTSASPPEDEGSPPA